MRVLAFVVFERRPVMRLRLFAPLGDKITSSGTGSPSGRAQPKSSLSILTEPHDKLASSLDHLVGAGGAPAIRVTGFTAVAPKAATHAPHEIRCCRGLQSTNAHSR